MNEKVKVSNKNAVVLMSFNSGDLEGEKIARLNFYRIKYLIENKIKIQMRNYPDTKIQYKVDYVMAGTGIVTHEVEKRFEEADLFIALISNTNVNVIFEVAVLNTLRHDLILLRDIEENDYAKALPIYFRDFAYINFYSNEKDKDQKIKTFIKELSYEPNFDKDFDYENPPEKIKQLETIIDEYDNRLITELQKTINGYEQGQIQSSQSFRKMLRGLHPSKALSTWTTPIPISVLKVRWNAVHLGRQKYNIPESMLEAPSLTSCNSLFVRLLGFELETDAFLNEYSLDGEFQIGEIKKYISEENFKLFEKDQKRILMELFFRDKPSNAKVPIEFKNGSQGHPLADFRNKSYLPVLIAKKVDGVKTSPHHTYYIIGFIKYFKGIKDLSEDEKAEILSYPE